LRKITAARIWGIIRHLVAAGLVTLGDKDNHGAGYSSTWGTCANAAPAEFHSHGVLADFEFSTGNACINL